MSEKSFFGELSKVSTVKDRRIVIPKEAAKHLGINGLGRFKVLVYMSEIAGEKVLVLRKVGK
ncbi:MAG: hypothetical protein QXL22_01225 [Candidatus Nezhaarchaeales archaeon]